MSLTRSGAMGSVEVLTGNIEFFTLFTNSFNNINISLSSLFIFTPFLFSWDILQPIKTTKMI